MEARLEHTGEEIKRLQRCINDLVSVLALPATWSGAEPSQVVHTLLDTLLRMLVLDLVYVRLKVPVDETSFEMIQFAQSPGPMPRPQEICTLLNRWLGDDPLKRPALVRSPIGDGNISIVSLPLGLQGEIGVIVAASQRADFPRQTESLILSVAANQASIGLQEAWLHTEELSLIVETIPGLVWCAAPDGELNYLNRRILDYTGTSFDAWAHLGWTNFLHPDDVEPTVSAWSRAVATGRPYDNQCRLRRSDGIYRWFQVLGQAARENKGGVTRWYGLLIDIDDRKKMEEALRANEQDLRLIVDTIPALVCTMTSRGRLGSVNQQAIDYCGYAPTDSSAIHPDDIDKVNARWRHSVETGEPHDVDLRLRRFDGVYRWFHVRGLPLRDAEGHILRWYILLTDIEDRRRAEEALRSSETRLSRATQTATVGEFAAAIAHEINQPLAAVVANGHACLRWLSVQPPGLVKAQEAAERIVRDGTEAGEVVRRIRALFKHAPVDKIDLDLNEVIAEVLRLLSGERTRRGVSVETDLDKDLDPVAGDRVQLQQVVFNLLLNGIEAMDSVLDRPKKLFIRSKRHTPETVLVEIRDSGVGLKDPEKVFEAFFTTKENGMGMGLAVCRSIIDAHHGRLWAASGEGAGTTFSFTVPAAAVPAATLPAAS